MHHSYLEHLRPTGDHKQHAEASLVQIIVLHLIWKCHTVKVLTIRPLFCMCIFNLEIYKVPLIFKNANLLNKVTYLVSILVCVGICVGVVYGCVCACVGVCGPWKCLPLSRADFGP